METIKLTNGERTIEVAPNIAVRLEKIGWTRVEE